MRGDESSIGTPVEDVMSLVASLQVDVPQQFTEATEYVFLEMRGYASVIYH